MIIWQMLTKATDYIWARPALMAGKFRSIELKAGAPANRAQRGAAYDYTFPHEGLLSERASKRRKQIIASSRSAAIHEVGGSLWKSQPE